MVEVFVCALALFDGVAEVFVFGLRDHGSCYTGPPWVDVHGGLPSGGHEPQSVIVVMAIDFRKPMNGLIQVVVPQLPLLDRKSSGACGALPKMMALACQRPPTGYNLVLASPRVRVIIAAFHIVCHCGHRTLVGASMSRVICGG